MSFEKELAKKDVEIADDGSQPRGQRTQGHFKRVIAAVRAAEAKASDEMAGANERCRAAQDRVIELQEENHRLREEVRKYEFATMLAQIDVSTETKKQLLGVDTVAAAG